MAKRLVLCFDGTWNSSDSGEAETNVARIARAVHGSRGDDGVQQITLYLRGVGSTGIALQRFIGGALGQGIDDNIRSGYMFLVQNYVPGDSIFLFGFSRGAYTARSLSGLIGACGLLLRENLAQLPNAWAYYRTAAPRSPQAFCDLYRTACHATVHIDFLGVWDTVGSLGIPGTMLNSLVSRKYQFHDTTPSAIVRRGRHALAIDEHRDEFEPTLWTGTAQPGCDIEQVWFAGAHSDVGGGYAQRRLADIPLRWMADEAIAAGLRLDARVLPPHEPYGPLDPLAPQHESRQSWSRKDRLTPTIRQVMGALPDVGMLERLYRPMDEDGNLIVPINESLHPSVRARFGNTVTLLADDAAATGDPMIYRPKNLLPLFGG